MKIGVAGRPSGKPDVDIGEKGTEFATFRVLARPGASETYDRANKRRSEARRLLTYEIRMRFCAFACELGRSRAGMRLMLVTARLRLGSLYFI